MIRFRQHCKVSTSASTPKKLPQLRQKIVNAALAALSEEKRQLQKSRRELTPPQPAPTENWTKAGTAFPRFLENNRIIAEAINANQAIRQKLLAELAAIKAREQRLQQSLQAMLATYQKYMRTRNYRQAGAILKKLQSRIQRLQPDRLRKIAEQYFRALSVEQQSLKKLFRYLGQQIERAVGVERTLHFSDGRVLSGTIKRYERGKVYVAVRGDAAIAIIGHSIYTMNAEDVAGFVPKMGKSAQLDYAMGVLHFYQERKQTAAKYFVQAQKNGFSMRLPIYQWQPKPATSKRSSRDNRG